MNTGLIGRVVINHKQLNRRVSCQYFFNKQVDIVALVESCCDNECTTRGPRIGTLEIIDTG